MYDFGHIGGLYAADSALFFTALNDGKISALISFGRTLVFQLLAILVLPLFLGLNGVWSANILAEGLALFLTGWCLRHYQSKYHY